MRRFFSPTEESLACLANAGEILRSRATHGYAQNDNIFSIKLHVYNPMNLKELSQAMHEFVQTKGWYAPDSPKPQTPRNMATSLAIETAEILEHFQWEENDYDKQALAGELADVTLYLLQLARVTEINLEEAILAKLSENYNRQWDIPGEKERSND